MNVPDNQWMLFGVDMRHIGQQWVAAWRDLLFSMDSPLRRRLDEPVALHSEEGIQHYQGGAPVVLFDADPACRALLLPEELVLVRELTVPLAAEAEIGPVIDLEVTASSPFPPDDTVSGWQEHKRDDQSLRVLLAIASRSALGRWLAARGDTAVLADTSAAAEHAEAGDRDAWELWARAGSTQVVLRGFGESRRDALYRQRLLRVGLIGGGILTLILLSASLFAVQQRFLLQRLGAERARVEREATGVAGMRAELAGANQAISVANQELSRYPNPHIEIARLTQLLQDDGYIAHFSMRGHAVRIRGRSAKAATVMQTLASETAYSAVTAPQAITTIGSTGLEQFHLDIELAAADAAAVVETADGGAE
ncbi:MAG: general secretion pathway protein L [Halieaceae bacterium]|jgi:general secretion pathway protein L